MSCYIGGHGNEVTNLFSPIREERHGTKCGHGVLECDT